MRNLFAIAFVCAVATAPAHADGQHGSPERAAGSPEKMICKRFVRTGSLIDSFKDCKSKKDWERARSELVRGEQIDSCRTRGMNGADC